MDRLFVYGSLQPGGPNEHELASIDGDWEPAVVKGKLIEGGWGASLGYPGLLIDSDGADVHGFVFSSRHLGSRWAWLDNFEGAEYERTTVSAMLANGSTVEACVYVLRA